MDCWLLSQPEHQWLWEVTADLSVGLDLWRRALVWAYRVSVPPEVFRQALSAETPEVRRLPRVF